MLPEALNDGFVVAITIEAKEEEADKVASLLSELVAPSVAEPGMKIFAPYRSPINPSLFFVFELYVNEEAWGAHQETAHFKMAIPKLLPLIEKRERTPFIPFISI